MGPTAHVLHRQGCGQHDSRGFKRQCPVADAVHGEAHTLEPNIGQHGDDVSVEQPWPRPGLVGKDCVNFQRAMLV